MNKTLIFSLGSIEGIPLGQGACFVIEGQEIAVFRSRKGGVFAIENRCPHRQGPLSDGVIGEGKVVCPLHGHKFDLINGQGSEGHECVKAYRAWERDGKIMVEYHVTQPASTSVTQKPAEPVLSLNINLS